jgi:dGTPase
MQPAGGFDHNAHTLRVLTHLESPYPRHAGYNLSWETLEGLAKHNGPVAVPSWALTEADSEFPLDLATWPGLEAQVAALADDIAYDNHDIDDGLRAGLFTLDDVLQVPLVARGWDAVRARFPDVAQDRLIPELIRHQIGIMVGDLLDETRRRLAAAQPRSPDDVRQAGRALVAFSETLAAEERVLKRFLYAHMYDAPAVLPIKRRAQALIANLFAAYRADPGLLPANRRPAGDDEVATLRAIGDYMAGMTDGFAIARHEALIGPAEMPEGF